MSDDATPSVRSPTQAAVADGANEAPRAARERLDRLFLQVAAEIERSPAPESPRGCAEPAREDASSEPEYQSYADLEAEYRRAFGSREVHSRAVTSLRRQLIERAREVFGDELAQRLTTTSDPNAPGAVSAAPDPSTVRQLLADPVCRSIMKDYYWLLRWHDEAHAVLANPKFPASFAAKFKAEFEARAFVGEMWAQLLARARAASVDDSADDVGWHPWQPYDASAGWIPCASDPILVRTYLGAMLRPD